jgi:predicted metal-binding protein
MVHSCCKGCTKRWVDPIRATRCHASCPDYIKAAEEFERIRKIRYAEALLPDFTDPNYGKARGVNSKKKDTRYWL